MTTHHQPQTADDLTNLLIALLGATTPEAQDRVIGRLIAGAIHPGKSSALYKFATRDELDIDRVLAELSEIDLPMEREAWSDALGRYALFSGEPS